MLQQLASKFTKLKYLKIVFSNMYKFNQNIMVFWQLLNPIIVTNNAKVELRVQFMCDNGLDLLEKVVNEGNLKITKIHTPDWQDDDKIRFRSKIDDLANEH